MAREIKDAQDTTTNELIYFKGHAKATYMSDGRSVEDAIKSINIGGGSGESDIYVTDFSLYQLDLLNVGEIDSVSANHQALREALSNNKVILVPIDLTILSGYAILTGYVEDLIYVTINYGDVVYNMDLNRGDTSIKYVDKYRLVYDSELKGLQPYITDFSMRDIEEAQKYGENTYTFQFQDELGLKSAIAANRPIYIPSGNGYAVMIAVNINNDVITGKVIGGSQQYIYDISIASEIVYIVKRSIDNTYVTDFYASDLIALADSGVTEPVPLNKQALINALQSKKRILVPVNDTLDGTYNELVGYVDDFIYLAIYTELGNAICVETELTEDYINADQVYHKVFATASMIDTAIASAITNTLNTPV